MDLDELVSKIIEMRKGVYVNGVLSLSTAEVNVFDDICDLELDKLKGVNLVFSGCNVRDIVEGLKPLLEIDLKED